MWLGGLGQICDCNTLAGFDDMEVTAFRDVDIAYEFVVDGDPLSAGFCSLHEVGILLTWLLTNIP